MAGLRKLMLAAAVAAVMITAAAAADRMIYVGGGKQTWRANVNMTEWSSREHFYVGNWLYFGFDKNMYTVLEVNKTSYDTCNEAGFVQNITKGGRDVFRLTEARTYYFISGRGFCYNGLKVAIPVESHPPAPAPAAKKNSAQSTTVSTAHFAFALVAALVTCLSMG